MILNTNPNNKMSLKETISLSIIFILMIAITSVNLIFSNTFGETCGFLHPYIFEAQVSMIDPGGGLNWNSDLTNLPQNESDVRLLDTYLRVYDEEGKLLSADDDSVDGDRTSGSSIEHFPAPESGVVLVEMGSYGDTGSGSYEINVSSSELTGASTQVLEVGSSITGTLYVGKAQRLSYPLEIDAGQQVIIQLGGFSEDGTELDTYLRLYDQEENLLAENDDFSGLSSALIFTNEAETRQSFVLELATFNDAASGDFTLQVESYSLEKLEGTALEAGITVGGNIASLQRYRHELALDAGQEVLLMATGLDEDEYTLSLNMQVFDENDVLVAEAPYWLYPISLRLANTGDSSARYTVEISTYNDSLSGSYELSAMDYRLELLEGAALEIGDKVSGELEMLQRERHQLRVEANSRSIINVDMVGEYDYPVPVSLYIYNENGELLQSEEDIGNGTPAEFYSETARNLIIEVGTQADAGTASYDISVSSMSVIDAGTINLDSPISARTEAGERLHYSFNIAPGRTISVLTTDTEEGATEDTQLYVYNESGHLLGYSYHEAGAGLFNLSSEEGETFTIEVAGLEDNAASFTLLVENFEVEILNKESVSVGQTIDSTIETGQRIRYPISLAEGQHLSLFAQGIDLENAPLYLVMRIYDSDGNELAMNDYYYLDNFAGAGFNSFDFGETRDLQIEISTFSDMYSGNFSLYIVESMDDIPRDSGDQYIEVIENDAIVVGEIVTGDIEVNQTYRYSLSLAANQSVIVQLSGESDYTFADESYPLNAYFYVYDAEHNLIKEGAYYDTGYIITLANSSTSTKNYFIEIYVPWDSGSFSLQVSQNSLDNFKRVFGVEISNGSSFSLDDAAYVDEEITAGERIRYQLEMKADESFVANFVGIDEMNIVVRVYSKTNEQLAELYSFEGTSQALQFRATEDDNYFIEVGSYLDSEEGEYQLLVLPVVNMGELNVDGEAQRNELRPNQRQQYRLQLEPGQIVDIRARQVVPESQGVSLFSWSQYALSRDKNAAQQWVSCLEYYGYVVDSAFRVNEYGISRFVLGTKIDDLCNPLRESCQLEASVKLTELGQILLYVILPGLAIILPVITVLILQNDRIWYWVFGLIVVAIFVLTSSLLYVHLGTVSGISALQDFGSGIFGGTATGAAIAFMTKVLENFSERKARRYYELSQQAEPAASPEKKD